uniref:Fibronectin type-III domain-containing protein n=1 Tax=Gouania willdenowi TaxID=441366 RepID=A0A8C5N2H7_GOUWI
GIKPDVVQNLTVMSTKPSEIHLNWVSPSSHVLQYKLEWHCGGSPLVRFTDDTSAVLSELIPGTEYTVTVTAVDNFKTFDVHLPVCIHFHSDIII